MARIVGATESLGVMLLRVSHANGRRPQVKAKVPSATTNNSQIQSYAELQEQLRRDLRAQHPEWIDADGHSPILDAYDRRLDELISLFQSASRTPVKRQKVPLVRLAIAV